ncbi:MAG: hypothetical protein U0787_00905 [Polyangia bacterium]
MQVCFRHARLVLGLALFAILLGGGLRSACAQELQVETAVQVALTDDASKTRNQALSDAMGQALLQAVEQSAPELRGRLYLVAPRAREFVSSYRVVEETEQDGRLLFKIVSQVDVARLLRELQTALPKPKHSDGKPSVLLCVKLAMAEPLIEKLQASARELLGQRSLNVELGNADRCGPGSTWPGMRLSFEGNLESAVAEVRGTTPRLWSAHVRGVWQFVVAPGAPPQQEAGDGVAFADRDDAALDQALGQVGRPLLTKLAERTGLLGRPGGGVLLLATGLRTAAVMNKLWKALLALPGVSRVEPRRIVFSDGGDEQVHFQLMTQTSTETLGTALYRTPVAGLRMQVVPLGPSALRLDCVPAQDLPSAEVPEAEAAAP